jgi:hypothetical protein
VGRNWGTISDWGLEYKFCVFSCSFLYWRWKAGLQKDRIRSYVETKKEYRFRERRFIGDEVAVGDPVKGFRRSSKKFSNDRESYMVVQKTLGSFMMCPVFVGN